MKTHPPSPPKPNFTSFLKQIALFPILAAFLFLVSYFVLDGAIHKAHRQSVRQKNKTVLQAIRLFANHYANQHIEILEQQDKKKAAQLLKQLGSDRWGPELTGQIPIALLKQSDWFRPAHDGAYSFIVDEKGQPVIDPGFVKSLATPNQEQTGRSPLAQILQEKSGSLRHRWQEIPDLPSRQRTIVFDPMPETGWIVGSWAWDDALPPRFADLRKRLLWLLPLPLFLTVALASAALASSGSKARRLVGKAEEVIRQKVRGEVAQRTAALQKETEFQKQKTRESQKIVQRLEEANQDLSAWVDELKQTSHEIQQLNKMSDLLQACRSVEETDRILVQLARELFPNDSGVLYRFNDEQNILETVTSWGEPLAQEGDFPLEDCWALRRGKTYDIDNDETDMVCQHLPQPPHHGYLCIPMMAQGELLGMLNIQWGRPDDALSAEAKTSVRDSMKRLVSTVTEQFTLALANLRLREMLRHQSIRDQLTGLYNRRHMEESLAREIHRAGRREAQLGLIMLDVDHFKKFNDTYGHEEGDVLLRELGAVLQDSVRQEDIACRYGGEEFLIIMPDAPLDVANQRAELIRERVRNRIKFRNETLTVSAGVAVYPDHGLTCEAVLSAADQALYQAKDAGRDRVVVWQAD